MAWLLKAKSVDFELIQADFGGPVFTSKEFLALNPNGFIPVIKDGDFSLYEGCVLLAIMALRPCVRGSLRRDESCARRSRLPLTRLLTHSHIPART